jgi:hypothetical protein
LYLYLSNTEANNKYKEREETWKLHAPSPPYQKTKEESTPPNSLSLQWPSWTKIYVEEKQKERKKEWERKEREDRYRCLQMSSNQTHLTKSLSLSHSLS